MPMDEYGVDSRAFDRRRQMAAALMNQQAPQGKMVGRVYVAANPLEYLAQGLKQYSGRKDLEQIDAEEKAAAQQGQARSQADLQTFAKLLRGQPAQAIQPAVPMDDEGNAMPVAQSKAVAGDPMAAYSHLAASSSL